ncbi:MAG: serine/threonine-protein kinase [Deltaproteobacteria bacterium]|nr:serine/threonine-protein kinase [Deltaproteobacteria bacterium]
MKPVDPLLGTLVAGRYLVERPLGEGGMGAVYRAVQEPLGRAVALKVILGSAAGDPQIGERFKREARLVASLVHPHIVTLHDFGTTDAGMLFLALELLEGTDLRARILRGAMPWRDTLPIIRDVAAALAFAHKHGVVHRDLKPENVFLLSNMDRPDFAKVLDFGISKKMADAPSSTSTPHQALTGQGIMIGTPGYMAPELVLEGKTSEPRSDLYALGVVWFEMLTGQAPFTAPTPIALVMRHAQEPAPSPRSLNLDVPASIEALVLSLLAKRAEQRPAGADAVVAAVSALLLQSPSDGAVVTTPPFIPEHHKRQVTVLLTPVKPVTPPGIESSGPHAITETHPTPNAITAPDASSPPAEKKAVATSSLGVPGFTAKRPEPAKNEEPKEPPQEEPPLRPLTVGDDPPRVARRKPKSKLPQMAAAVVVVVAAGLAGFQAWNVWGPCPVGAAVVCEAKCERQQFTSCARLGDVYERPDTVVPPEMQQGYSRNPVRALGLYQLACDHDDDEGCGALAVSYLRGEATAVDVDKALRLGARACENGGAAGCEAFGALLVEGRGVAADERRGERLLAQACQDGARGACARLGQRRTGKEAQVLFLYACDGGDGLGCFEAGKGLLAAGDPNGNLMVRRGCDGGVQAACVQLNGTD